MRRKNSQIAKTAIKPVILREVVPEEQKEPNTPDKIRHKSQSEDAMASSSSAEPNEANEEEDTENSKTETAEIVSLDRFRKDPAPKP